MKSQTSELSQAVPLVTAGCKTSENANGLANSEETVSVGQDLIVIDRKTVLQVTAAFGGLCGHPL